MSMPPEVAELLARMDQMGRSESYCVVTYDPETKVHAVYGTWDMLHAQIEAGQMRESYDAPGTDLENVEVHVAEFRAHQQDGTPITRTVRQAYRIETKKPRPSRGWRYLAFTGSTSKDLDEARRNLRRVQRDAPGGWRFRIATRTVVTEATNWTPLEDQ